MTELVITRGLPASGKTTVAREWVTEDIEHRARINRDDFRAMAHNGEFIKGVTERQIIAARDGAIVALLKSGVSVVNDDTNLPQRTARDLARLAARCKAEFRVVDFTHVPVDTCIERDGKRDRPVGETVIRDMHSRYLAGRDLPLPMPEEPAVVSSTLRLYKGTPDAPATVLCDIDGTVALRGTRSPFDETRVHEDRPNGPVVSLVWHFRALGYKIVFVSGRSDVCREATVRWLQDNKLVPENHLVSLFMRAAGDTRKDSIVKAEIFDEKIRDWFDVKYVLDDRNQVVAMWRELGIPTLQVADGDF